MVTLSKVGDRKNPQSAEDYWLTVLIKLKLKNTPPSGSQSIRPTPPHSTTTSSTLEKVAKMKYSLVQAIQSHVRTGYTPSRRNYFNKAQGRIEGAIFPVQEEYAQGDAPLQS